MVCITNWSEIKINDTLRAIRTKVPTPESLKKQKQLLKKAQSGEIEMNEADLIRMEKKVEDESERIEKERNKWLVIMRSNRIEQSLYTLGEYGVQHACDMRQEPYKRWKITPNVQARHFLGVNEVLCRLRRAGVMETDWLSAKEVEQWLFYYWQRLKSTEKKKKNGLPYKPDAYLELDGVDGFFIEFDTGSESIARLRYRFFNCLRRDCQANEKTPDSLTDKGFGRLLSSPENVTK